LDEGQAFVSFLINSYKFKKGKVFNGGDLSIDSLMDLYDYQYKTAQAPTSGGSLTVDGKSLGSYDYTIKTGNQVVSSFNASDWFTDVQDSRSGFIFVDGDLTIDVGQIFTPSVRKLFTAIYVRGNLTVNGAISMTARGANHSATGSDIPAQDILLALGTYTGITDPKIPAIGGAGGTKTAIVAGGGTNAPGAAGSVGSLGGTGGGGTGAVRNSGGSTGTFLFGAGSDGTSFCAGGGGGGTRRVSASTNPANVGEAAFPNGGAGGQARVNAATNTTSGGCGNPSGVGSSGAIAIPSGSAGSLIVFANNLSGSGQINSNGSPNAEANAVGGGAGGGGSVTVFVDTFPSFDVTASGGVASSTSANAQGGAGGNGTARILLTQSFSPAVHDYFFRVGSVGGVVTHPEPIAAYIDALAALGGAYWDTMGTHCLFSGVTFPGCFVPLRNGMDVPTNFNFVSGDHNSVTGLVGNGSTKYINTNRNNNAEGQNDQSVSVYIDTPQTADVSGLYFGVGGPSAGSLQIGRAGIGDNLSSRSRSGTSNSTANGAAVGFVGLSRSSGSDYVLRANASDFLITQASQTPFNGIIHVFRYNVSPFSNTDARLKAYHIGPAINQSVLEELQNTLFSAIV
jgi:hypothetical protein